MQRMIGDRPPRYRQLLRLTLAAALVRLLPLAPFFLVYFLPLGPWFRLVLVLCPVLWAALVFPARVRFAGILAAFAKDGAAPLEARELFGKDPAWRAACLGRLRLMGWRALPLAVLLLFLLPPLVCADAFTALKIILGVFTWIAGVIGTAVVFLPRLLMGEPAVAPAGIAGGAAALAAALLVSLCLFGWGAFCTSAYRFGYTGMPKARDLKPLLKQNLRLWLPTLILLLLYLAVGYGELGLSLANFLSAAPVFTVKPHIPQIALAALTAASYLLLLPLRRLNTARWAQGFHFPFGTKGK